jgi:hypothetical protein
VSLILLLIGTLLEIYSTSNILMVRVISCFSIIKNTKILFKISTQRPNVEYQLQFIHGLRVLGTLWVLIAHSSGFILVTVLMKISPFSRYPEEGIDNSKTLLSQFIINASLAVQVFFIMRYINKVKIKFFDTFLVRNFFYLLVLVFTCKYYLSFNVQLFENSNKLFIFTL